MALIDFYFSGCDCESRKKLERLMKENGLSFSECVCLKDADKSDNMYEMLLLGRTETPFLVSNNEIFEKREFEKVVKSVKNGLIA